MAAVLDHDVYHGSTAKPDQRHQRRHGFDPLDEWYAEHKRAGLSRSFEPKPGPGPESHRVRSILQSPSLRPRSPPGFGSGSPQCETRVRCAPQGRKVWEAGADESTTWKSGPAGPPLFDGPEPFFGEFGNWQENADP